MTISLTKNAGIDLNKEAPGLSNVFLGLGWDASKPVKRGFFGGSVGSEPVDVDLDASVVGFDTSGKQVDQVWFRQLKGFGGAVQHSGDNRTGDGDGDDETISVDLSRVPSNVATTLCTVNSFLGQPFDIIDNAVCRLVDAKTNKEIARIELAAKGAHTGLIMAALYRTGNGWSFKSISEPTRGRTIQDMAGPMASAIAGLR